MDKWQFILCLSHKWQLGGGKPIRCSASWIFKVEGLTIFLFISVKVGFTMLRGYTISELEFDNLQSALSLVWKVFLEFVATDYGDEGVQEFRSFIEYESIKAKFLDNQIRIWTCFEDKTLVGVLAASPPCHISLLFVDKQHHKKGIARAMFTEMADACKLSGVCSEITVNSSPYAVEAYRKLGFESTDVEQIVNGIRFIPMKRPL